MTPESFKNAEHRLLADCRALVTGDWHHVDFQTALAEIWQAMPQSRRIEAARLRMGGPQSGRPEVSKLIDDHSSDFRLAVYCQSLPGQLTEDFANRLIEIAPSAPLILLLGSQCEGQSRIHPPPANVQSVYWHQWSHEFQLFRHYVAGNLPSQWDMRPDETGGNEASRLSATGTRSIVAETSAHSRPAVRADLWACDRESCHWLCEACQAIGVQIGKAGVLSGTHADDLLRDDQPHPSTTVTASITIAEIDSLTPAAAMHLVELRRQCEGPMLVVAGFPRWQDQAWIARVLGGTVLGKPFSLQQFSAALASLASNTISCGD